MDKCYEDAYFTLEASLIFPMAILFTTMMIFLSFYAYDRCLLEHSAYQAALIGAADHIDDADKAYDEARKAAALLIQNRVFAIGELTYDVLVDTNNVTVTYHCTVNMPFKPWIREYIKGFSDKNMTFDVSKSAPRIHAARRIREFRIINNLTGIGGVDDEQ